MKGLPQGKPFFWAHPLPTLKLRQASPIPHSQEERGKGEGPG